MITIEEHLKEQKINYTTSDGVVFEIEGYGKLLYEEFKNKKSIYRLFDDGENKKVQLNMFYTPAELESIGVRAIMFYFGSTYNYIELSDPTLQIKPLLNLGLVKLTKKYDLDYVNLGIHTHMELLNGSGSVSRYLDRAEFLGHKCVGVCDYNTLGSVLDLQKECTARGMNYVFGYSTSLATQEAPINNSDMFCDIKLYVKNNVGLNNMHRVQKCVMVDSSKESMEVFEGHGMPAEYAPPKKYITLPELKKYKDGLILVLGKESTDWLIARPQVVDDLINTFGDDLYFQIDFNEYQANRIDMLVLESIKKYFNNLRDRIPPVLICDTYYANQIEFNNKATVNKIGFGTSHMQSDQQWYKDIEDIYHDISSVVETDTENFIRECIGNSVKIAQSCDAKYDLHTNHMPIYDMTPEEAKLYKDPNDMFDKLLEEGFKRKVPKGQEDVYRERLEMEKYVIKSTNNVNYMLNQYDVVRWAESSGIIVGAGRGSAGGSLVLYLLNVTKVDPIRFNLLFERFLLPERAGLYESTVTIIDEMVDDSDEVVEIEFDDGRVVVFDLDSQISVVGAERALYADELEEGQEVVFDNIHNLFDIK